MDKKNDFFVIKFIAKKLQQVISNKMTSPTFEMHFSFDTPKDLNYTPYIDAIADLLRVIPTITRICDVCTEEVPLQEEGISRECSREGCDSSFDVCKNCEKTYVSDQCPPFYGCNDPDVQFTPCEDLD
jgi:hypothetical protein